MNNKRALEIYMVECAQCKWEWIAYFQKKWVGGMIVCPKCSHYGEPYWCMKIEPWGDL